MLKLWKHGSCCWAVFVSLGPAALAQFTTVVNVPPDPAPHTIAAGTQINVFEGGVLPGLFDYSDTQPGGEINFFGGTAESNFAANSAIVNLHRGDIGLQASINSGSVFNIFGGVVGPIFDANAGSVINVFGGRIETGGDANSGSVVNIHGGTLDSFSARAGSSVTITGGHLERGLGAAAGSTMLLKGGIIGGQFGAAGTLIFHGDNFAIDGEPVAGLSAVGDQVNFQLPLVSQFTGTFADGTPFSFSYLYDNDQIQNASITLIRALPPDVGPPEIRLPQAPVPQGVRSGQTLIVSESAVVGNDFRAGAGSTVVIDGGSVGDGFEAAGTRVDIHRGTVGGNFGVFTGSFLNILGGNVGHSLNALPGSSVNIAGGTVQSIYSHSGAEIVFSGGSIRWNTWMRGDTEFEIHGDNFHFNGVSLEGQEDTIAALSLGSTTPYLLTGTLSDGTPFAFHNNDHDTFELGTLSLVPVPIPPIDPGTIVLPESAAPPGIRAGQTVLIHHDGELGDNFNAGPGSAIEIDGGAVANDLEAIGAKVHLKSGQIGDRFDALEGTQVIIEDGSVGEQFYAAWGSDVTILGGQIGGRFTAANSAVVKIHGGRIASLGARTGAQIEIDGGGGYTGLFPISAGSATTVHLIGTQFLLDGVPITGLTNPGDSLVLANRNGELLEVRLRDGSTAQFLLRPDARAQPGNFALDSTLRLTLVVPEPSGVPIAALGVLFAFRRWRRSTPRKLIGLSVTGIGL